MKNLPKDSNYFTRIQLKQMIEESIERMKNPDPREIILEKRQKKRDKIASSYGLA